MTTSAGATAASTAGSSAAAPTIGSQVMTLGAPQPAPAAGCANGDTSAEIGGSPACLAVGQQCQQASAAEYPVYGYLCMAQGNGFKLFRK